MSVERLTKREKLAGHNIAYVSDKNCFDVCSVPKNLWGMRLNDLHRSMIFLEIIMNLTGCGSWLKMTKIESA